MKSLKIFSFQIYSFFAKGWFLFCHIIHNEKMAPIFWDKIFFILACAMNLSILSGMFVFNWLGIPKASTVLFYLLIIFNLCALMVLLIEAKKIFYFYRVNLYGHQEEWQVIKNKLETQFIHNFISHKQDYRFTQKRTIL